MRGFTFRVIGSLVSLVAGEGARAIRIGARFECSPGEGAGAYLIIKGNNLIRGKSHAQREHET